MTATAIRAITVNNHYQMESVHWLETDCADYTAWSALPPAVTFEGRSYGRTGWNSDRCIACYSTQKPVATF
jgi:hypothetical protein